MSGARAEYVSVGCVPLLLCLQEIMFAASASAHEGSSGVSSDGGGGRKRTVIDGWVA